jgi:hypothetical protein
MEYQNYPLREVAEIAQGLVEAGGEVHQKFTCGGCGKRLTMDEPNIFYTQGTCDNCDFVTNIEEAGCNYMVHFVLKKETGGEGNDA